MEKDEKGKFKPGNGGRPKGSKNKVPQTIKEMVLQTFNELQEDPKTSLLTWGKKNLTEFYKISSKLIPHEISGAVKMVKLGKDLEDEIYAD
jgi:hypothetical protein